MIQQLRNKLEQKKGQRNILLSQKETIEDNIKKYTLKLSFAEKAQLIIQHVAKQTQQELEFHISNLVTMALESVLIDPYEFQLEFEFRRNKTEADLWFVRNNEKINPLEATGGGAVDIAAFALRIALWSLQLPKSRNTFFIDEPFKNPDKSLRPKVGQLLKELSNKLNLQIIMVTHDSDLIESADKVFYNTKDKKGNSKIETL
jgi:ABC-type molybdate transport system ATPase subunit